MKIVVVVVLSLVLFILVKRRLLQIDLSFPWFLGLVLLGFVSVSDQAIIRMAAFFDIIYPPLVVILIALFILLGLLTILAILYSRLRGRQELIVRRLARLELERQAKED